MTSQFATALVVLVCISPSLSWAETNSAPLKLNLEIQRTGQMIVPRITIQNVSKTEIDVVKYNADYFRRNEFCPITIELVDQARNKFDPHHFSLVDRMKIPAELGIRRMTLQPNEVFTQDCRGFKIDEYQWASLPGIYKVNAKYSIDSEVVSLFTSSDEDMIWCGTVESRPVEFLIKGSFAGVGKTSDPLNWAHRNRDQTIRLGTPYVIKFDEKEQVYGFSGAPRWLSAESRAHPFLPKGWVIISADSAGLIAFRNTGGAIYFPVNLGDISKDALLRMLKQYGAPEALVQKPDLNDQTWVRELDGARIHYQYSHGKHFTVFFEAWEEEWDDAKPEIDAYLKLLRNPPARNDRSEEIWSR